MKRLQAETAADLDALLPALRPFPPKTEPLAVFNQTLNPCRPDLVGFVNGLPLVVIELKKPGVPALASAFIKFQRDESALLLLRRDPKENRGSL